MCGIAGFVAARQAVDDPKSLLATMVKALGHRGPDGAGVHLDDGAGLGHTRLAILDIAGGYQPMSNEDGSLWITFNGEIFNHVELRQELLGKGHVFSTRSDTEVILHLFEQEGEDCVRRLNGQWAFAIWNQHTRTAFLSRDRFGVRPLFYTSGEGLFLFASEIKAILAAPGVSRRPDLAALDQILTYWCTLPPRTMFEGIWELPPGCSATVRDGEVRVRRHWRLQYAGDGGYGKTPEQYAEELLDLLTDATRIRLRSDVPVGAYLSGGLDSTVTTALVRGVAAAPLRTFSLTFDEAEYDESSYQREAVRVLETDHCEVRVQAKDIGAVFPEVIRHTEKPLLRTAPAPMYLLARLVRDSHYKVVITGEGADEMLGGYDIFKEAKIRRFCAAHPESTRRPLLLKRLYPYLPGLQAQSPAYLKAFFRSSPEDVSQPFFSHRPRWEMTAGLKQFLTEDVRQQIKPDPEYKSLMAVLDSRYPSWDYFSQAQYLETTILMPGYILSSQGDRVSMAHGVEGRFPFLDHRVAEFSAQVPPRLRMKVLREKYLLRLCSRGIIPSQVTARTKQPYRAPEVSSFFGHGLAYVDEMLSEDAIRRTKLFRPDLVRRLVEKAKSRASNLSTRENMAVTAILSAQLWSWEFLHR